MDDIEKRGRQRAVLLSIRDYVRRVVPEPEVLRIIGRNPNKEARISSVQGRSIRSSKPLARHGGDESACVARRRHKEGFELEGQDVR